jgi:hypothetical protein
MEGGEGGQGRGQLSCPSSRCFGQRGECFRRRRTGRGGTCDRKQRQRAQDRGGRTRQSDDNLIRILNRTERILANTMEEEQNAVMEKSGRETRSVPPQTGKRH